MSKIGQKGFTHVVILTIILLIGAIGGTGYYVFNSHKSTVVSGSKTQQSGSTLEGVDSASGIHYKKINMNNKVLSTLEGIDGMRPSFNGFYIVDTVKGTTPEGLLLPEGCTFNLVQFGQYYGGIAIYKNLLKDVGIKYSDFNELADIYKSKGVTAETIQINNKKVLKISDGGKGIRVNCKTAGIKYEKSVDFGETYILNSKSGDDIFVTNVLSDNTADNVTIDISAKAEASKLISAENLKTEVEHLLTHN